MANHAQNPAQDAMADPQDELDMKACREKLVKESAASVERLTKLEDEFTKYTVEMAVHILPRKLNLHLARYEGFATSIGLVPLYTVDQVAADMPFLLTLDQLPGLMLHPPNAVPRQWLTGMLDDKHVIPRWERFRRSLLAFTLHVQHLRASMVEDVRIGDLVRMLSEERKAEVGAKKAEMEATERKISLLHHLMSDRGLLAACNKKVGKVVDAELRNLQNEEKALVERQRAARLAVEKLEGGATAAGEKFAKELKDEIAAHRTKREVLCAECLTGLAPSDHDAVDDYFPAALLGFHPNLSFLKKDHKYVPPSGAVELPKDWLPTNAEIYHLVRTDYADVARYHVEVSAALFATNSVEALAAMKRRHPTAFKEALEMLDTAPVGEEAVAAAEAVAVPPGAKRRRAA